MEIVIVICLLIVIALLLQDKIVIKQKLKQKQIQKKVNLHLPDIMGQPKSIRRHSVLKKESESQIQEEDLIPDKLDIEYDKNENVAIQIPQEELDEVFSNVPDFEEEEEEWSRYGIPNGDNGLAQGVTFEELSSMRMLLQAGQLETSQKETAVGIVQKIQGTELFSLLENSMESASRKIAELLDSSLSNESDSGSSSSLRKNDLEDFDMGEFV